jgi:hypothetical protein
MPVIETRIEMAQRRRHADAVTVFAQRLSQAARLQAPAFLAEVGRVSALGRVAQDGDEPRPPDQLIDSIDDARPDEVHGRDLADGPMPVGGGEQRFIGVERADREQIGVLLALVGEEVGLLEIAHEDLRVLAQIVIQRRRPGPAGADDQEVG